MKQVGFSTIFCIIALVVLWGGHVAGAQSITTALSTHVLNITLTASGNWPTTDSALQPLGTATTTSMCTPLNLSASASCSAFLMVVSTDVLAVQVNVETATVDDAAVAYRTLSAWSINTGSPPLDALQSACAAVLATTLTLPVYTSGEYVMPCRNSEVYTFLPVCQSDAQASSVVYIADAAGVSLQNYFSTYLCDHMTSCSAVVITVEGTTTNSTVTIQNAAMALEAILSYVADVRANYIVNILSSTTVPPVGNVNAGVSATSVQMRDNGLTAVLFDIQSTEEPYPAAINCPASYGFWAFALIGVIPFVFVLFRYAYYRGGHHAKKRCRSAIIEDEKRTIQGYANPSREADVPSFERMESVPPPGGDANAYGQWVVDENGNYYEISGQEGPWDASQQYLDPNTQELADIPQGAMQASSQRGAAVQSESAQQSEFAEQPDSIEDAVAPTQQVYTNPETGEIYQTYLDPNTNETYQYVPAAEDAAAAQDEYHAEVGTDVENANGLVTYVDPQTGDTYQYYPNAVEDAA